MNIKSALVIGTGVTGKATISFLENKNTKVYLLDNNFSNLECYKNTAIVPVTDIDKFDFSLVDVVIPSPSICTIYNPHKAIVLAKNNGIPILTDIDVLRIYHKAKIIGITGTNGKSTTVTMIYHVLKQNGFKVFLCGNIGIPVLSIDQDYDYVVIELSSYQLESTQDVSFDYSAILNISPSHLDHHGSFEAYKNAKLRICNSKSYVTNQNIACTGDKFSVNNILSNGISVQNNEIYLDSKKIAKISDFANTELFFNYNPENICVVFWLALKVGLNVEKIVNALKTYNPLPHRSEFCKQIGRISFVNDSKATNIPAVISAIHSKKDIVLIMGGQMLTDYSKLQDFFSYKNNIKKVFLIGESENFMFEECQKEGLLSQKCGTIDKALKEAYKYTITLTKNNKWSNFTIILCPMHPSLDQFKNFEERGNYFKLLVDKL